METPTILIESLFDSVETYSKTTFELAKLKALETTTIVATTLISRLGIIAMILMFVLVLTIGIALLVGEIFGKPYYGFFIVAAFYLVAGIVFRLFLHKWIKKPISDLIIMQALQ